MCFTDLTRRLDRDISTRHRLLDRLPNEADLRDCMVALPGQFYLSMKITEDFRKHAVGPRIVEEEAIKRRIEEK